jgi:metal-dependent hydrolase (beta-lactamase superfamily II)
VVPVRGRGLVVLTGCGHAGAVNIPHCTGWKAQHRLAAALPEAFVPNAVGTSLTFAAPGSGPRCG